MENLFDTINNPETSDDEFTPSGERHWNSYRYRQKLIKIWKALAAGHDFYWPDIIGICEVENSAVIHDLIHKTPLGVGGYSFFHRDSYDRRGIDVALLYRTDFFQPVDSGYIQVSFPKEPDYHTRDILYMKGFSKTAGDTLVVFVNHWPSRYGGFMETEGFRHTCAKVLRRCVDSVTRLNPASKILIIGDFNDTPYNESVTRTLKAEWSFSQPHDTALYNISYYLAEKKKYWTYWYQGRGDFLDQVIVSGALLNSQKGLSINPDDVYPLRNSFLFDEKGRPFRTYMGPRYMGGFSDHLPMVINFQVRDNAGIDR
ncbi:MAG: endonuclease [Bacteroidales bacterium]|nr:endonuclease [Bacteroidales bacterium]